MSAAVLMMLRAQLQFLNMMCKGNWKSLLAFKVYSLSNNARVFRSE